MPTPTYQAIATTTVGAGGSANITFSSIPSTYTDLLIMFSGRSNYTATTHDYFFYRFNSDSGSNYTSRAFYGDGSSAASLTNTYTGNLAVATANTSTSNSFGNTCIYIPNYTGSTNKSSSSDSVHETNATPAVSGLYANRWGNTAAITSVTIVPVGGTLWNQYSSATLYGIKNS